MTLVKKITNVAKHLFLETRLTGWCFAFFGVLAVFFRLYALGRIPGINGDEAWYGVQIDAFLAGENFNWRTPTGLIINPLHSGILLMVQFVLSGREYWMLRFPSFVSSCLAMGLSYFLLKKIYGKITATVAFVLFSSLPVVLAYSRFGWDVSHMFLVALICCFFALENRPILCSLTFAFVLWVHPTGIFIAPTIALIFLGNWLWVRKKSLGGRMDGLRILIAFSGILVVSFFFILAVPAQYVSRTSWFARVFDLGDYLRFITLYGQLFSGTTIYRYIVGQLGNLNVFLHDGLFWIVTTIFVFWAAVRFWREKRYREICFLLGILFSSWLFYLFAGTDAISPHYERYATGLVAPFCIVFSICVGNVVESTKAPVPSSRVISLLIGAWFLASFSFNYIYELEHSGSTSHRTFFSGSVEPKEGAFEIIRRHAGSEKTTKIYLEDWWLYYPMKYISANAPFVSEFYDLERIRMNQATLNLRPESAEENVFVVVFAGGMMDKLLQEYTFVSSKWDINAGRSSPILKVYEVAQ